MCLKLHPKHSSKYNRNVKRTLQKKTIQCFSFPTGLHYMKCNMFWAAVCAERQMDVSHTASASFRQQRWPFPLLFQLTRGLPHPYMSRNIANTNHSRWRRTWRWSRAASWSITLDDWRLVHKHSRLILELKVVWVVKSGHL